MNRKKPSSQLNRSLIDGIATLQALSLAEHPIGSRDLARQLNMETTRVNRLLKTLAYIGVARQTKNRKYAAGPGMHVIAAQSLFASQLIRRSLKPLESLKRFGLIVALGVLWRDNVSYLYHATPEMPSNEALGRIGLYPATAGGVGMALLAQASDKIVSATYAGKPIPHFPGGTKDLLDQLEVIRKQGYAYVETENADQHTLAVVVGKPVFCAIGVSGWIPPTATVDLVRALMDVADTLKNDSAL